MNLQPLNLTEGQGTVKLRAEQLSVFISHCNNAIRLATEIDPYHIDVIKSLRAALEMKGFERVKEYIDRHAKEESVCFILKDTASFIEKNRDMNDSDITYKLNQIQLVLDTKIKALYNSMPVMCPWLDSAWDSLIQKITDK